MASSTVATQQTPATPSGTGSSSTGDAPRARRNAPPWAIALVIAAPLALAYLIVQPPAGDLAAAIYRSDLFARVGFALRDNGWYAAHGHYLPGYSLISPELGAWIGVYTVLALSAVAASVLFGLIAERVFSPAGARVAAGWFALGFGVGLLSGRVPYDLGFAIGLGSVLALLEERLAVALGLAVLTSLASPVAGAFLALAGVAYALVGAWERRGAGAGARPSAGASARDEIGGGPSSQALFRGSALALATLVPIAVLAFAFPEGGWEPFAPSAFWPALGGVLLIALLLPQGSLSTRGRLLVRVGAVLYALALIGSFALHTPVGGNSARLGALLAGPLLAGVVWDRHRLILCLLVPLLLYWQIETPINDELELAGDPSVHASYYAPLRAELRTLTGGRRAIVEVPMMGSHGEAAYLAGHDGVALARGWERQLDTRYAHLFYVPGLSAGGYEAWLRANRVVYVALPDVRLDEAGHAEGALIARGLPYLHELWHSAHWRLYAFQAPPR
ncbi:MAG TPA: hypothetical protein VGI24_12435 [Solirubrobacteraceae bacterium]|jgi:hypothetical protein